MPKVVDHDSRRAEVAEAVLRVIARDGIDRTTVRGVADEAGWSTGVLAHYFGDKAGLLRFALLHLVEGLRARLEDVAPGGLVGLREALAAGLPLDEQRRVEAQVWMNFVGRSLGDPDLAAEIVELHGTYRHALAVIVRDAQDAGEMSSSADAEVVALTVSALADGITMQVLFAPKAWTAKRQLAALDQVIDGATSG